MENLREKIDKEKIPEHIAIIMDGNGRWAKKSGHRRVFGHKNGVKAVRAVTEAAAELGVKFLTLYAFSTENWSRPKAEVNALMQLLINTMKGELPTLMENNIRLKAIGDLTQLPVRCKRELEHCIGETQQNNHTTLVLALSYSSKWEITMAVREIARKVKEEGLDEKAINEDLIKEHLTTAGIPDPDLLIRTSGEYRISNFLLWQCAYSEFYFTDKLWPDFQKDDFFQAIIAYQGRNRRFGKIQEQITNT